MSEREPMMTAEAIIRQHDSRCAGEYESATPWCSCAPEGSPLCVGCTKLAEAIAAAIARVTEDRDEAQRTVRSMATMLGWANVPPRETLERTISSDRARFREVTADRDRLRAALETYGRHQPECDVWSRPNFGGPYVCNCGLTAALSDPGRASPPQQENK